MKKKSLLFKINYFIVFCFAFTLFSLSLSAQTQQKRAYIKKVDFENKPLTNQEIKTPLEITDSLHYDDVNYVGSGFVGADSKCGAAIYLPESMITAHNLQNSALLGIKIYLNPDELNGITNSRAFVTTSHNNASEIYSQDFVAKGGWNYIHFITPISFSSYPNGLYVGCEIEMNTALVVLATDNGPHNNNANWYYDGVDTAWFHIIELDPFYFDFNWDIRAMCGNMPTSPEAYCFPDNFWNADYVDINTSKTSGTYKITNVGVGNLTCSGVSGFNQGFSSTIVPEDINLSPGQSYSFTVSYNPTTVGESFTQGVIATNGGTIIINLLGYGIDCSPIEVIEYYEENFEQNSHFKLPPCWQSKKLNEFGTGWISAKSNTAFQVDYEIYFASTPEGGLNQIVLCNTEDASFEGYPRPDASPDQWLISPQIKLSDNDTLSFYVQYFSPQLDLLEIKISETDDNTTSFVTLGSISSTDLVQNEWKRYKFPLGQYANKTVYIAFREFIENTLDNSGLFAIDRFAIFEKDFISVDNNTLKQQLKLYPSPADNYINVEFNDNISSIEILNTNGKTIKKIGPVYNKSVRIDINDLSSGIYFIKVFTQKGIAVDKFIVK